MGSWICLSVSLMWVCGRDEAQISRLQQLGMTSTEEAKLQAMKDYVVKLARAISRRAFYHSRISIVVLTYIAKCSFASRVSIEVESDALKVTTTIELQKLGVVPQTVFLRTPDSDGRPSRISAHRLNSDLRSPGTPRTHRTLSIDHGPISAGAPFEDLRRRLALINNSANSLAVPGSREPRSPVPHPLSVDTGLPPLHVQPDLPQLERPSSPAESTVSTTNSSALRAMHRFPIGDGQKAAPAVGSSKASATGLLEAHAQILSEGSQSPSGRTSPVSVAGTIRGQERPRLPSIVPISSYGGSLPLGVSQ